MSKMTKTVKLQKAKKAKKADTTKGNVKKTIKKKEPKAKLSKKIKVARELTNKNDEKNTIEENETKVGFLLKAPPKIDYNIDDNQIEGGLRALLEYQKKKNAKNMFSDDLPIFLQILCVKIPKTPRRHIRLTLKHTLVTDKSEVCLIVSDLKRGRKVDHEPTIQGYQDLLKSKGVTSIQRILPIRELKIEYSQYELKRRLCARYDYFLVDGKISKLISHYLGKAFIIKRKIPTPVRLSDDCLKATIDNALCKVPLHLHGKGNSYIVQIGHSNMPMKNLTENLKSVVEALDDEFPGGWNNVRALHVKTETSIAIPVYMTLKDSNSVDVPIIRRKLPKLHKPVFGELSTRYDSNVIVYPTGEVVLNKIKNKSEEQE